jgi:hypothetical protein
MSDKNKCGCNTYKSFVSKGTLEEQIKSAEKDVWYANNYGGGSASSEEERLKQMKEKKAREDNDL